MNWQQEHGWAHLANQATPHSGGMQLHVEDITVYYIATHVYCSSVTE